MLKKQQRFHGSRAITRLYKKSTNTRGRLLGVRFRPCPPGTLKAAVIVSRKIHKSAVIRNRIRRRIYEQLRLGFESGQISGEMAITVFDVRVATLSTAQLANEINSLLKKAIRLSAGGGSVL